MPAALDGPGLDTVYLRWAWCRAVLYRGWWLVTSVYLVVDAGLSASELVLVGVAQSLVALVFEVPADVLADTVSRKWSLVASHALMGTAMVVTGLVTGFGPLVATQLLWGLSWTLPSGADVAWITDELDAPARILGLAAAPAPTAGGAAVLLAAGALPLTRTIGTIWVDRQTGSDVRATVHSFLAQASAVGTIACGLAVAAVARLAGLPLALATCGALLAVTVVLAQRLGAPRAARVP